MNVNYLSVTIKKQREVSDMLMVLGLSNLKNDIECRLFTLSVVMSGSRELITRSQKMSYVFLNKILFISDT